MLRSGLLAREQSLSVDALAERFGLSRRTIFRVLCAGRKPAEMRPAS